MKNFKLTVLKLISICILTLLLFSLCSCKLSTTNTDTSDITDANTITTSDSVTLSTETVFWEETTTFDQTTYYEKLLPLPESSMEFSFLSGAGAWRTYLILNDDGSFSGIYYDSEMGAIGDGYPKGSKYICEFTGKFTNIEKVHEFSYKMTLSELEMKNEVGDEWIEDEIKYIASEPYGLSGGTEFAFFIPTTPIANMSEDFLSWWPFRYEHNISPKDTLSCYGIMNVATLDGFFGGY